MQNPATPEIWRAALDKSYGGNPLAHAVNMLKAAGYDGIDTAYQTVVFNSDDIKIVKKIKI